MNLKAQRTILFAALVAVLTAASPAWGSTRNTCTGGSNSATWDATPSTLSIDVGGSGSLGVNMTSPMCLNTYPNFPSNNLSVFTDVGLASAMCPDGSSGSTADCPLTAPVASISGNPEAYSHFGETQTYVVQFDATNATPGFYTFHVHANSSDPDQTHQNGDALDNYGWGYGGGVLLTVTVAAPQPTCDPTNVLNVVFTKPTGDKVLSCNGGTSIPVDVTASDTNNLITSLTVSVTEPNATKDNVSLSLSGIGTTSATGTGSYTAGGVGAYVFEADAATACTTGKNSVTVPLVYDVQASTGNGTLKAGRNFPITFTPTDCHGNPVPYDSTVHLKVLEGSTVLQDATINSCTGSTCGNGSNAYVTYNSTSGQYQSNFNSPSTPATYTVQILFGGVLNNDTFTFTTTP